MKRFQKFTQSRFKHLKHLLKRYASIQDPETLHLIRVEIKRIKSALQVIGFSEKNFKAHRAFLPFRDIFRKAGAIREPQVLAELLVRHNVHGVSTVPLSKDLNAAETFLHDLTVFLENIQRYKGGIIEAARKTRKKDFRKYINNEIKGVKHGLCPKVIEEDLHKVRKRAKNIIYMSAVRKIIKKKYRKFLADLEEIVGGWHDKQIVMKIIGGENDAKLKLQSMADDDVTSIGQLAAKFYQTK